MNIKKKKKEKALTTVLQPQTYYMHPLGQHLKVLSNCFLLITLSSENKAILFGKGNSGTAQQPG